MEVLSKCFHPNIVKYHGCLAENRRITAVCMERCVETLQERMDSAEEIKQDVLKSIRNAAMHMHSLGYCHNDISPFNIMFRSDGSVVLIDFDSTQPIEENLGYKRGAPGFYDKTATTSIPANDFYSIARIEEYLTSGELPPEERIYDDMRRSHRQQQGKK